MNYKNFVCAIEGLAKKFHSINPDMHIRINHTDRGLEVTCMPLKEIRDCWISQMLSEYREWYESHSEIIVRDSDRKIMVVHFRDYWDDDGCGVAKCSPDDKFDEDTGLAVAFAHFRGYEIPDYI